MRHEQVYMSAEQLGISEVERDGLLQLAGELERGDLPHVLLNEDNKPLTAGFNMNLPGHQYECGTAACIGGWLSLRGQLRGTVNRPTSRKLRPLFWPDELDGDTAWFAVTPLQAARAIRNFLTNGLPRWREAVGA